ncbi:Phosphoserine phosphatase (EC 3.1.3.3), partial [uncultured Gammaproteobacteria bacterium]
PIHITTCHCWNWWTILLLCTVIKNYWPLPNKKTGNVWTGL